MVTTYRMGSWYVFSEGDALYDAMISDLAAASHSIQMESYIFASDTLGAEFVTVLADAARRGVHVSLRVDHAGSFFDLARRDIRFLRDAGVDFRWSRRWSLRHPWRLNRRNHRKLLVVDRRIAYLGGFNIHDPGSLRTYGSARWRDTHLRLDGPLAESSATVFDACRSGSRVRVAVPPADHGKRLIPTSSRTCRHVWRCVLQDALLAAANRIWVTTPYFVPDHRLQGLLIQAARQNIDVRLLVPGKNDVPLAQWAARSAYSSLLAAGVRIYEYLPRVLHAKTILVDSNWASLGTANLDYRSLFVNDEITLTDSSGELNAVLTTLFERDLEESAEVRSAPWRQRPWTSWLTETIGWVMRRWL